MAAAMASLWHFAVAVQFKCYQQFSIAYTAQHHMFKCVHVFMAAVAAIQLTVRTFRANEQQRQMRKGERWCASESKTHHRMESTGSLAQGVHMHACVYAIIRCVLVVCTYVCEQYTIKREAKNASAQHKHVK